MAFFWVSALKALPPGSKANIKSINLNFQTDLESGFVLLSRGVDDLVIVETGQVDLAGARFTSMPSAYNRQDV